MISELVKESIAGMRWIGTILLILLGLAYASGFLIFNIYLGRFGAVSFEIVHARFLSTGLLYLFIQLLAVLAALGLGLSLFLLYTRYALAELPNKRKLLLLVAVVLIFALLFLLFEEGIARIAAMLLQLTSREDIDKSQLLSWLRMMCKLQGSSTILGSVAAVAMWKRVFRPIALFMAPMALVFVLAIQVYLLLAYAERLYPWIPSSVGGGKPCGVCIVTHNDVALAELGVQIHECEDRQPETNGNEQQSTLQTCRSEPVTLLDERPTSYLIGLCSPQDLLVNCSIVQINKQLILGLEYQMSSTEAGLGTQP